MTIVDKLLTKGAVHGRTGELLTPKGIVVHYAANASSTATANRNYFDGGSDGRYVSSHYIIDLDGIIIRCVPDNERAVHASAANATHIGIECCHTLIEQGINPDELPNGFYIKEYPNIAPVMFQFNTNTEFRVIEYEEHNGQHKIISMNNFGEFVRKRETTGISTLCDIEWDKEVISVSEQYLP